MIQQTAVVLGATGLIGHHVVEQLLQDNAFAKVRVLVRRPFDITHPKLEVQQVNFDDEADFQKKLGVGDSIFCCVGTTNAKVKGDKKLYRKVDFDIPVHAAQSGSQAGFANYLLVSAVGANATSNNFYVKLKGEVEQAIETFPFQSIHIFKPSILLGKRSEYRFGETVAKGLMQGISFLLAGRLKKYRGIEGADVARAMIVASKQKNTGIHKYEYEEIIKLIEG